MAYNTRSIKRDVDGRPVPQYFNSTTDDYEPLLGENGAARSVLYGPNGQPLSVIDNKLAVRAADLETLIGALNDSAVTNPANNASVIAALKGLLSVVGKEATLGQILSALGALATETTLGGVKTAVDVLAGTVDTQAGVQKVALSGSSAAEGGSPPTQIVAVGGRYDATPRALQSGQHGAIALSPEGRVIVEMVTQSYRLFTGQMITAGASVATPYIEVNGYNKLGVFVHADQPTNHEFNVEMSPNQTWYISVYDVASRPKVSNAYNNAASVQLGITQYARVRVFNTGSTDRQFDVWVTLVF